MVMDVRSHRQTIKMLSILSLTGSEWLWVKWKLFTVLEGLDALEPVEEDEA